MVGRALALAAILATLLDPVAVDASDPGPQQVATPAPAASGPAESPPGALETAPPSPTPVPPSSPSPTPFPPTPAVTPAPTPAASVPAPPLPTPAVTPAPSRPPLPALVSHATVVPVPTFPPGTFRADAYALPRLAWSQLPYNGLSLLSTSLSGTNVDADGIPYKVVGGHRYYNPGTIAQQGCRYLDAYVRTGNAVYLDRAERRALRLHQLSFAARGARWLAYRFDYGGEGLSAPWVSALAQGGGLSFFVRLYRVTGDHADLTMARNLFMSFRVLGRSSRPWVGYVDSDGYLRLEEYPGPRPSHVFNGANFGYFGIYDYAMLTGDWTAIRLVRAHLTAMRHLARSYRDPGWLSYYDLTHRTQSVHYHAVNRWQLLMLGRMGGGPWFTELYRQFKADYPGGTYP